MSTDINAASIAKETVDALDDAVTDYRSRLQTDKERHLFDKVMNEHGFNYVPDPTEYEGEDPRMTEQATAPRSELPDEMAVLSGLLRGMARRQVRTSQVGDMLAASYDEHVDLLSEALKRSGWTAGTSVNALKEALGLSVHTPNPEEGT